MITDKLLTELRFKGEGSDLDYKAERYVFANASDIEKSELLKDILALANAHREGTAYILIGFKENPPNPAEIVGLTNQGTIDDSRLQQFVNSKLETNLIFRYEERLFEDKHIAVISIPKQPRPFYLLKDYGKLDKNVVYIRRGSSTAIASPREVALMGASQQRGEPELKVVFEGSENEPLPVHFEKEFLRFSPNLPDYRVVTNLYTHRIANPDFLRDAADYCSIQTASIRVRLSVFNQSSFSLEETQLEVMCRDIEGKPVPLCRADDLPDIPSKYYEPLAGNSRISLQASNRKLVVDERGKIPTAIASLGTILPQQTRHIEEDLVVLPAGPGHYSIQVVVYSNELSIPASVNHQFEIAGKQIEVSDKDLDDLVSQAGW